MDRYRKILAVNPNEPIALNNLAYALAVRKGQAAEAIGYAERANTVTRGNPTIADTLAWIQHLLGRDREAAQLLSRVVKALPGNAEVRLHAAVVYAAVGMLEPAAKELQEALRLDPALAKGEDVKALQARLGKK
jgi:Flp pilus assembly protein TadD